jgi:hypothetical protein
MPQPYGIEALPTNVVMLLAGSIYVKELPETDTLDCVARLKLDDVIVGVRDENVGAFVMLNVCDTAEPV